MWTGHFDPILPRRVLNHEALDEDVFALTFERRGLTFEAGRHVAVGLPGDETREYSLYSGESEDTLKILVRRVEGGRVSRRLALLRPGDLVTVRPPRGRFLLKRAEPEDQLWLIATGTGVAPFRSFLLSRPGLNYTLVHGVRRESEHFSAGWAEPTRTVLCLSRPGADAAGRLAPQLSRGLTWLPGRVTDWLDAQLARGSLPPRLRVYLCGNQGMLDQVRARLWNAGLEDSRIHTEKYF